MHVGMEMPSYWGWVEKAHFAGNYTIDNVTYDSWEFEAAGTPPFATHFCVSLFS